MAVTTQLVTLSVRFADANNQSWSRDNVFQLDTTTTTYATDVAAFALGVFNEYTATLVQPNVQIVEVRARTFVPDPNKGLHRSMIAGTVLSAPADAANLQAQLTALLQQAVQMSGL